jgi:antibiotic biosynthesis monooxygenase (ABM) superfamily enzyme
MITILFKVNAMNKKKRPKKNTLYSVTHHNSNKYIITKCIVGYENAFMLCNILLYFFLPASKRIALPWVRVNSTVY